MPAIRSRTENWRKSLEQIYERNGALEITLPRYIGCTPEGEAIETEKNLIWRVRILGLSNTEIQIEEPMALGEVIHLEPGIELVGLIVVGQNRWLFRTRHLGLTEVRLNDHRNARVIRLQMPDSVERCQRRDFYRLSTAGLSLPRADVSVLLDPASAALAEAANRIRILDRLDQDLFGHSAPPDNPELLPKIGPRFTSTLVNVGGGGVGLLVESQDRAVVENHRLFWLRIGLEPHIPIPLAVTARLRHTHIDSSQNLYAGMQFEFGHDPAHERFVVDQLCRYVAVVQREQLRRKGAR